MLGRRETGSAPSDLSGNIALGARSSLLKELSELDEQRARLAMKRGRAILEDGEAAVRAAGIEKVSGRIRHGDVVETVAEVEEGSDPSGYRQARRGGRFCKIASRLKS